MEGKMDSDDLFWLAMWRIGGAVVITLILTIGACDAYTSKLRADLVQAGADPLAIRCLSVDLSTAGGALLCTQMAGKQ